MDPIELKEDQTLYQLLTVGSSPDGVAELRQFASVSVGNVDAKGASVFAKSLSEWADTDLNKELKKALAPDPFALMAKAWVQVREVREAVKISKGPPATTHTCSVLKHEIEAKLEPRLVLNVGGIDWCDVKLAVVLKLNFDSVNLEWTDGSLSGLEAGNPSGTISLKCAEQEVKAFKRDLKLKASYRFEKAVAITSADSGEVGATTRNQLK